MSEIAISLKDAAQRLGVSYQTVFHQRQKIGFRVPGTRIWRVWPSTLAEMSQSRYKVTRLTLRDTGEKTCRLDSVTAYGGLISQPQAAKELDALLGRKTVGQRRNTTTA